MLLFTVNTEILMFKYNFNVEFLLEEKREDGYNMDYLLEK